MSEQRFEIVKGKDNKVDMEGYFIQDTWEGHILGGSYFEEEWAKEDCEMLNEQEATIRRLQDLCGKSDYENVKLRQEIKELKAQLREKEEDERLYANEIVKLNKEAKEVLDFKSLGGDY